MIKKKGTSAGLDIGDSSVKLVELARTSEGLELASFGVAQINGKGKDAVIDAIKRVIKETPGSIHRVNVAVFGESVIVRYIDLPRMTKAELASAIKYEAEQYLPLKMDEVNFDFYPLEEIPGNKVKVLLVAARKELINEQIDIIKSAGLFPGIIDIDSFCLINCFEMNGPKVLNEDTAALLHIGHGTTSVNILKGNIPYFTRDIYIGTSHITEDGELKEILEEPPIALGNLLSEVRLCFDHYENQTEKNVGLIYLSGGGTTLKGLSHVIHTQLGVEAKVWDPLTNIKIDHSKFDMDKLKEVGPILPVGIGLALRR